MESNRGFPNRRFFRMKSNRNIVFILFGVLRCLIPSQVFSENLENAGAKTFAFHQRNGEMGVTLDNQVLATYVWKDPEITRPYFKNVRTTDGVQVTRSHPPKPADYQDHKTYHPGIWWGFGDVDGNDYWRMKAGIIGGNFIDNPVADKEQAGFGVKNLFLKSGSLDEVFLEQVCRYTFFRNPRGVLLIAESVFLREEGSYWLGDQEEMGFAFRANSQLATARNPGSKILNANGISNLKTIRTTQSDWVDYSGPIDEKHAGLMLMSDPENFRKPWWHAVDTGLLVANAFGRNELNGRGKLRQSWWVPKGEPFRLCYGIYIYSHPKEKSLNRLEAYQDFLKALKKIRSLSQLRSPRSADYQQLALP